MSWRRPSRGPQIDDGWAYAIVGVVVTAAVTVALVWFSVGKITVENCLRASVPLTPVFVGGLVAGVLYGGPLDRTRIGFRTGLLSALPLFAVGSYYALDVVLDGSAPLFQALAVLLVVVMLCVMALVVGLVGQLGAWTGDWLTTKIGSKRTPVAK